VADEKKKKPKNKGGRPTSYTPELAAEICQAVATSEYGLKRLCEMHPHWPAKITINLWRFKDLNGFSAQYNKAKQAQIDLLVEQCMDISDDISRDTVVNNQGNEVCNSEYVNRSRLRVDTRKWIASKLVPRVYGDAKQLEIKTEENEQLKEELKKLRLELAAKNSRDY
jgi:hypothetical protein